MHLDRIERMVKRDKNQPVSLVGLWVMRQETDPLLSKAISGQRRMTLHDL